MANTSLFFDVFARDRTGNTFSNVMKSTDSLGSKLVAVGKLAAVAAAGGLAIFAAHGVRSFLAFDDKMTQSLAIMGQVSGPMREKMENAARAVGKSTRFGADQAAEAYFFLASAGLDAEQSIAAMPQVAKFATAGMFDLARATDLATDAQSALGLTVDDPTKNLQNLTRVTDVLTKGNILANASVEQFSTSLTTKAGAALRSVGKDVEEGVAVLAAFADQGVKGEEAGTQLSIVMRDLQTRALANKEAFEEANVAVFDQQGEMNNLGGIIGQLEQRLSGMSDEQKRAELATLGFTDKSIGALLALLGTSDAIARYEGELRNAAGTTQEVADKQLTSFAARFDLIKSKVEDASISVGKVLVTALFTAGEHVAEMGRILGELPDAVQIGVGAVAGLAVAAPIAVGAFRRVKAAIDAVKASFAAMSTAGKAASLSMGAVGLLLAAGGTILAFFANRNLEAKQRVDSLADSLDQQTGAVTENTREIAFNNLEQSGAIAKAKELGISLDTLVDAYLGDADAIDKVNEATSTAVDEKGRLQESASGNVTVMTDEAKAADVLTDAISVGNEETAAAAQKQRDRAAAGLEAADADAEVTDAVAAVTTEVEEQVSAVEELITSLDEMVTSVFAARDAERGFEEALDTAQEAAKENGATLDITTEKGRKNQEQLDRLAESALKDAAATLEDAEAKGDLAAGHQEATGKMQTARAEFVKVAKQMGLSTAEAEALADQLGLIPGNYNADVNVDANTGDAFDAVGGFIRWTNKQTAAVHVIGRGFAGHLAKGGFARRGSVAVVGEEGPELVTFAQDAHVTPAGETKRMLRGDSTATTATGAPTAAAMPTTVKLDASELASALDGMTMVLQVDGQPVRGIVRTELNAHDRAVKRAVRQGATRAAVPA